MEATMKPGSVQQEENNSNANAEPDLNLLSMENMDRSSPELWPDKYQEVQDFINMYTPAGGTKSPYSTELTNEDKLQIQKLRTLSTGNLILKVKELHDMAYQLGVEESKEMTRGIYLNIFNRSQKDE